MKLKLFTIQALLLALVYSSETLAFCGFYVAKADTKLFNKASKVVLVRNENRTVLTMANDYQGDLDEFAVVIPVPTFLERDQIHVGDQAVIDHLDAYTSPRLVEYFDENPCTIYDYRRSDLHALKSSQMEEGMAVRNAAALGVKIEAKYTIGEYDIVILSASQSDGLETWLRENDYKIPTGASDVLRSYIKQGVRFFVAKVNLGEQAKLGFKYLRPLQIAFESPKFMLPIRLGTVNADGDQELFVFALTQKGRVETTNYRTVKLPSGSELPVSIKDNFANFYRDMFSQQVKKENMRVVFLEYAWDMGWCDPCAADPLTRDELQQLGVFWLKDQTGTGAIVRNVAQEVFVTRLHVRYDGDHFPEDLVFQETADRKNFQGRYVLRHPWDGTEDCEAAKQYRKSLAIRQEKEAQTLASLTGWDINEIRADIKFPTTSTADSEPKNWWQYLWNR